MTVRRCDQEKSDDKGYKVWLQLFTACWSNSMRRNRVRHKPGPPPAHLWAMTEPLNLGSRSACSLLPLDCKLCVIPAAGRVQCAHRVQLQPAAWCA